MKEEIQYKSISIRLVTLIGICVLMIASIVVINYFFKNIGIVKEDNIEIANVEENTEEEIQETRGEITVSSRSAERSSEEIIEEEVVDAEAPVLEPVIYKSIEEVTISKTMDLTERTGLSKKDFITLMSNVKQDTSGFFEENAGTIYDVCEKYQLNEIFFCGLISAESGWTIAQNHRNTYNYISLMSNGKLIQFASVEEGLEKAAEKLHNNYLTPGGKFYYGKTLSAVKTKFCPASSTWVDLVYGRMQQIVK